MGGTLQYHEKIEWIEHTGGDGPKEHDAPPAASRREHQRQDQENWENSI